MAQSSPQRRRYLAARRRGLSQIDAMRETGVSRSTAWRADVLLHREEAARAAVLERVNAKRTERENDDEAALREAERQDVSIEGQVPVPPWGDSQNGSRPTPSAEESLVEDDSYPVGLLERRIRVQGGPQQPPRPAPGAIVVGRGEITDSMPPEPLARVMPL